MIPVFVISLESEQKRRDMIATHLKERGFECHFFNAIDGRQMDVLAHPDYQGEKRRAAHGRDLKPGELGCFLSHRAVYAQIVEQNLDYALVVEDDARFDKDTKIVLESLLAKNFNFDIVRLLGSPKVARGKHRRILALYENFYLVRLRTTPGGAHATLISQKGAQKLVKATRKFAFPIDTVLGRCIETGIDAYSIQPGLATQDLSFDSTIGEERHDKTIHLKGLDKLHFKLTRLRFKIGEAAAKTWTYYANTAKDLADTKKFG